MKNTVAKLFIGLAVCLIAVSSVFAQQNYKIRQTMSMNGQKSESTIYVKNSRKRTEGGGFMGVGGDVVTIEQCDLKRNVKFNDDKKLYFIEPFASESTETTKTTNSASSNKSKSQTPKPKMEKGGIVTYNIATNDTGERKPMFGLTARHIKSVMTMESSANACTKGDMKIETDGWYVDLPDFSCPYEFQRPQVSSEQSGGCKDDFRFKVSGTAKTGFPLIETRTIKNGDADFTFTQTTETIDFSKAMLDVSLFDYPKTYQLAISSEDLYGKPDFSKMAGMMNRDDNDKDDGSSVSNRNTNVSTTPKAKKAGTIRIGVFAPTNRNGDNISTTNMQLFLTQNLTSGNVEAVNISSEADGRAASCDYILTSDFSKLKQSTAGKIGGMFGKVTGADTSAIQKYDAQVDFKLVSLANGQTFAQNKALAKSERDADKAAETALAQEAKVVLAATIRK